MQYRAARVCLVQMDSPGSSSTAQATKGRPSAATEAPRHNTLSLHAGDTKCQPDSDITPKKRQFWSKLGVFALWALSLGTVLIILALAFLSFLWKGVDTASSSDAASAWRAIMINNWAARSITLSSLVLRWSVGAQAGVCTSMLAAFILEHGGVALFDAAGLSLLRSSNNGPYQLVKILALNFPRIPGLRSGLAGLILLVSTLLLQFSSTALLSDLGSGVVLTGTQAPPAFYYRKSRSWYLYQVGNNSISKPQSYPTFAEAVGSVETIDPASELIDTGKIDRALLPLILPSDRTLLVNYSGMATVVELGVSCFRPEVKASLFTAQGSPRMWGTINPQIPGLTREPDLFFNCTLPLQMGDDVFGGAAEKRAAKEWATAKCLLDSRSDPTVSNFVSSNDTLLIFNMTQGYADVYGNNGNQNARIYNTSTSSVDGPWVKLSYQLNSMDMDLAVTICVPRMKISNRKINAYSDANRTEPVLGWDPSAEDYRSEGIRRQLGVLPGSKPSVEERGLLRLSNYDLPGPSNNTELLSDMLWTLNLEYNVTTAMCTHGCYFYPDGYYRVEYIHRAQIAVFQDILTTTRNPAQALLAQYFTLLQMAYYDALPEFDDPANATARFYVPVTMPVRWRGFATVVTILSVHFVCVLVSTKFFLRSTRISLLGSSWQAVAQVAIGEAEEIVAKASMASDSEIKKEIKGAKSSGRARGQETNVGLMVTDNGTRAGLFRRLRHI
jgi:hypothetical protein